MRRSLWKPLLWQAVGLLFYLAGMLLFLVVAVTVYQSPPANSLENIGAEHVGLILVSVALIVAGRVTSWKFGGGLSLAQAYRGASSNSGPEQSRLQQLGYRVQSGETADETPDVAHEDGEATIVCRECGTRNEPGYTYCRNCSAELPE